MSTSPIVMAHLQATLQEVDNLIAALKQDAEDQGIDWLLVRKNNNVPLAAQLLGVKAQCLNGMATLVVGKEARKR